ncbi:MAG: pyrophosphatase PpaX [Phascolarctobacterium sp.]|nr:pyrophosphatase PpaX [Phascolarctobacterium sp.]
MEIKGLLFDFDGTLANTIDLILATFRHTFKHCLNREIPEREIIKTFGLPLAEAMARYAPTPAKAEEMCAVYREYNLTNHDRMIKEIPGTRDALENFHKQGLKLAVVTSKKNAMTRRGLKCCGLDPYVSVVVSSEDTARSKPHPEPMLKACELLGLKPEECICVGDSPFDLQSGRAAGALTAAVTYTSFVWQDILEDGQPDFIIDNICDLITIIDKINFSKEEI